MPPSVKPQRLARDRGAALDALREGPGTLHDLALRRPEVTEYHLKRALASLASEGAIEERWALSPGSRQHCRIYALPRAGDDADADGPGRPGPAVAPQIGRPDDKARVLAELRRAGRPLCHAEVMPLVPGLSHFRVRSALFGLEASGAVASSFAPRRKLSSTYRVRVYTPTEEHAS